MGYALNFTKRNRTQKCSFCMALCWPCDRLYHI